MQPNPEKRIHGVSGLVEAAGTDCVVAGVGLEARLSQLAGSGSRMLVPVGCGPREEPS